MPIKWEKLHATRYPGIRKRSEDGALVVRVKQTDPRTGKKVELFKTINGPIEEALAARADLIRKVKTGNRDPHAHVGRTTLGDYAKLWIVRKRDEGLREHTLDFYVDVLERRILPYLGDLFLDTITSRDVFAWKDRVMALKSSKGKKYSRWTVAGWFAVMRNIIGDATLEYDLPRNPAQGVPGPKKPRKPRAERFLPLPQLQEFLTLVREHHQDHFAITLLLAVFGLRWEEVSALHASHIDEQALELRVVQAHVRGKLFSTKNESAKILPLAPEILSVLQAHTQELLRRQAPGFEKGILFPSRAGTYRVPSSVFKAWRDVSQRMGLPWVVQPHDLRRSYQNILRQANVGPVVQQALMGHSSAEMTEHYSFVQMDEKRAAHRNVISLLDFKKSNDIDR